MSGAGQKWICGCALSATGEVKLCSALPADCDKRREEDEERARLEREREGTLVQLAVILFAVSAASPKPHTPHVAIQQATAFMDEVTKKFGEMAARRIF